MPMETEPDQNEIDAADEAALEPEPGFGEQDEAAQEAEWEEAAEEGGVSEL